MDNGNDVPVTGAIYHSRTFCDADDLMSKLEDSLFRFCLLYNLAPLGGHITSVFLSTSFNQVNWYSGLFNCCDFLSCQFESCTFRGTSFPDCRFVDCRFSGCRFVPDNLGGECVFDDAKWYGCLQAACEGLPEAVQILEEGQGTTGKRCRRWR